MEVLMSVVHMSVLVSCVILMAHVESSSSNLPKLKQCLYSSSAQKCPDSASKSRTWRRQLHIRNQKYPIRISVTDRASHRIVSYILDILLREKLGYESVEFVPQPWDTTRNAVDRLTCSSSTSSRKTCDEVPPSFIDLEVWMPPGFSIKPWQDKNRVVDCGPLGAITQMGLYLHWAAVASLKEHIPGSEVLDHYQVLQDANLRRALVNFTAANSRQSFSFVMDQVPVELVDRGNSCPDASEACLYLYTDRTEFLEPLHDLLETAFPGQPIFQVLLAKRHTLNQIFHRYITLQRNHQGGNVSVPSLLGPNGLVVNWFPSELTVNGSFTRVLLPEYSSLPGAMAVDEAVSKSATTGNSTGPFDLYQLTKVVWAPLQLHAKQAFELVNKLRLSQDEYEDLLRQVDLGISEEPALQEQYFNIACNWVRSMEDTWQPWVEDLQKKDDIMIGALFPLPGLHYIPNLQKEAESAIQDVNMKLFAGTQYRLVLDHSTVKCHEEVILEAYLKYFRTCDADTTLLGVVAALPCASSLESMVKLANMHHVVVVSPTVNSAKYLSSGNYSYFFRTMPSMRYYSLLLTDVFRMFGWHRVFLLRRDDHYLGKLYFKEPTIAVLKDIKTSEDMLTLSKAMEYLRDAQSIFARIFVVEHSAKGTGIIMCAAAKLNMSLENGYVWILNALLPTDWYKKPRNVPYECSLDEMRRVVDGYLFLQSHHTDGASLRLDFVPELRDDRRRRRRRSVEKVSGDVVDEQHEGPGVEEYRNYTYDAVYVLGVAMRNLLLKSPSAVSALRDRSLAETFRAHVAATNWTGPKPHGELKHIHAFAFNKDNERSAGWWSLGQLVSGFKQPSILRWYQEPGLVSSFTPNKEYEDVPDEYSVPAIRGPDGQWLWYRYYVSGTNFTWPTHLHGQVPDDGHTAHRNHLEHSGEVCRLTERLTCAQGGAFLYVILFIALLLSLTCLVRYYRRRLRLAKDETKRPFERLCEELQCLDIPSSDIVVTREIGKGAFGIVYGGEMRRGGTKHSAHGWINVAVKMAHPTTSYEVKTELLLEAKLMASLSHPNVLRMYGVCLHPPGDFLYLVLESMRCSDLRTFLLARRADCVREPDRDDVCPETLTRLAIDVATGVDYLHSRNLLHRDIACRNCLVTVTDDVHRRYFAKISDFGLAREMKVTEADRYYRFKKNKEMPIRWMSPEAMNFGRFDVASEIWSYGVLLFEMVTFGSHPFADLLDVQVIDLVKRRALCVVNCLPRECENSQVYKLIQWCCQYQTHHRPCSMAEILGELKTDPRFVRACLTPEPPKAIMSETKACVGPPVLAVSRQSNPPSTTLPASVPSSRSSMARPSTPVSCKNQAAVPLKSLFVDWRTGLSRLWWPPRSQGASSATPPKSRINLERMGESSRTHSAKSVPNAISKFSYCDISHKIPFLKVGDAVKGRNRPHSHVSLQQQEVLMSIPLTHRQIQSTPHIGPLAGSGDGTILAWL